MDKAPEATRILIVDDEPANVELLVDLLSAEGYRAESAGGGGEALSRARENPPDLIVLDVLMPGMDGFAVCQQLKADVRTAPIPILLVTGLDSMRDKERGLAAGADDYVTKPVVPADVITRVRSLLRVSHLSQELDRTLAYLQELENSRQSMPPAPRRQGAPGESQGLPSSTQRAAAVRPFDAQPHTTHGTSHILVVDDEQLIRQMYARLLEEAGHRATTAASAVEAYEAAARGVDVILLDIMMPDISGLDALGRLRQIAPDVPILIVTAYQSAQNAIAALRGGAFDFIVKGMKHEMLLNAVARAIERRRLALENRQLMEELRTRLDSALAPPSVPAG